MTWDAVCQMCGVGVGVLMCWNFPSRNSADSQGVRGGGAYAVVMCWNWLNELWSSCDRCAGTGQSKDGEVVTDVSEELVKQMMVKM